jgi:hypothetical protein
MTSRKVLVLAAVAVVVLIAALLLSRPDSSHESKQAALYPALKSELNSVTAVRIFKAGDVRAVELMRDNGEWSVSEREGYPADAARIRKLLLALADAKTLEQKTSNPENYPALSLEDLSKPNAGGSRVEVAGVATPVDLIIGKSSGVKGTYVRRAGEPASWLVDQTLEASTQPSDWLRTSIIDVSADRVHSVTVTTQGAKPYSVEKAARADPDFKASVAVPKGKEIDKYAANGFASALTSLTLSDVHSARDFENEKPAAHARIHTFDGLVVDLDGWTRDGKHFIAARTSYDEALAKRFHVETKAPEKTDATAKDVAAAKPATPATDDVAQKSKDMNTHLTGWVFEISDYKYEAIFKPATSLLKDLPAKK